MDVFGVLLILAAGLTQGAFPLPLKFARAWEWEHMWFWYSALSLVVLPVVLAWLTVPQLGEVFARVPLSVTVMVVAFGLCWGAGSVCFGLGIDALGMALGFPLMTGLFTSLGALVPLVVLTPELIATRTGAIVIAANAITIVGVAICGLAGKLRDDQLHGVVAPGLSSGSRSFRTGLIICVAAGVLSSTFNFGYAFGKPILDAALDLGASESAAANALWLAEIPPGGLLSLAYCLHLARRQRSLDLLMRGNAVDWVSASAMAALWTGSVVLYGWGAQSLGRLAPTLGWSLWNMAMIATTIVCGLLAHEWDGARGRPLRMLYSGIALLVGGMCVLGFV